MVILHECGARSTTRFRREYMEQKKKKREQEKKSRSKRKNLKEQGG